MNGVLFDVDGTLVDTTYLHTLCWAEAFRQVGKPQRFLDVHRTIGRGGDETLDFLLGEDRDRSDDEELQNTHTALYKTYWGRLQPLPGARELLHHAKAAGLTVVLASSASKDELDELRSVLDCDDVIDVATSSTDADAGKPAPDLMQAALDKAGLDAEQAVYVGDSIWDGITSGKAGLPFVGVLSGGISAAELRDAGAVEIWSDPADILEHFAETALGRLAG
jgi:HAD superfamily hydrolase (TIGR01509 family)